ncbi:MAG: hypothetical protein S4CHLAM37_10990 [Chlamydiia bacterium]|nr:hypothetical protein [Chlamydiia bacterium]
MDTGLVTDQDTMKLDQDTAEATIIAAAVGGMIVIGIIDEIIMRIIMEEVTEVVVIEVVAVGTTGMAVEVIASLLEEGAFSKTL